MKKILFLLSFLLLVISFSCDKDDETETTEPQLEYTEDGLQVGIPPFQQDTIVVNSSMTITTNQEIITNNFNINYELALTGFDTDKLKPGTVIIDYNGNGRLWVVKEVINGRNSSVNIIAILGSIATLCNNLIVEISTAGNRAKSSSTNPNKLENSKYKLISATDPIIELNIPNINIENIEVEDGVNISVNNNTVVLTFTDFELYNNSTETFNITIPSGNVQVNNALDIKMKFNPITGFFYGIPMNLGAIKEFKSSIYTVVDSNINLNIQATTNGTLNLVDYKKDICSYVKLVVIPPFAFTIKVNLAAKLDLNTNAELIIFPQFITKNNFELRADYNGEFNDNILNIFYQNIENDINNEITGDFNFNQRLEIIPEVEILAYGLIGPSGQIIPYEELDVNAELINDLVNWDVDIDLGMDYYTSLDVSILHIDDLTQSLINKEGNLYNYDLYSAPFEAEIISGNNQEGETNTELNEPITLIVRDNFDNAIPNVAVHFEAETGNGVFENEYVYTNADGIASNSWILGNNTDIQIASAFVKNGAGEIINGTQINLNAIASGNNSNLPTITTNTVSEITETTATSGGNVTGDGGNNVTARGVCWSTNPNPTTTNSTTYDGTGSGIFTSSLTGLIENTTYYVRAYATNSEGTGYGNEEVFMTLGNIDIVLSDYQFQSTVFSTSSEIRNFSFSNNGLHLYMVVDDLIHHYILPSPFDLSNLTSPNEILVLDSSQGGSSVAEDVIISQDGTIMYIQADASGNFNNDYFQQYSLVNPYSINNVSYIDKKELNYKYNKMKLSSDNSKLFIAYHDFYSTIIRNIKEFEFSTANDITSVVQTNATPQVWENGQTAGIFYDIVDDFKSIYITDDSPTGLTKKFILDIPGDISSMDPENPQSYINLNPGERIIKVVGNEDKFFTLLLSGGTSIIKEYIRN
ncbi:MAG: hypothetical protein COB12_08825 [Flavobacterium sp.]|nr:MAG: hypothetical protein COB12_08825 [Flavobacterium sp.]